MFIGKCEVVTGTYYAPYHEDIWGSGGIAPLFLHLDTGQR
jgi:hypothetical protein